MQFFTWFDGIFSAATDKARLISIIISAVIAIFVVLLNQHLTTRRENKKLHIEKLEEAYETCDLLVDASMSLYRSVAKGIREKTELIDPSNPTNDLSDKVTSKLFKLMMILKLHTNIYNEELEKLIAKDITCLKYGEPKNSPADGLTTSSAHLRLRGIKEKLHKIKKDIAQLANNI